MFYFIALCNILWYNTSILKEEGDLMNNKEVGRRITKAREEKHLNKKELAVRVGVADSTIKRYEDGAIKKIKMPVIESIAKALSVNPMWLIGRSKSMKPEILKNNVISLDESIDKIEKAISRATGLKSGEINDEALNKLITLCYKLDKIILESPELSTVLISKQDAEIGIKKISQYLQFDWRHYDESVFYEFIDSESLKEFFIKNMDLYQQKADMNKDYLVPVAAHNDNADDPEQQRLMEEDLADL